MNKHIKFTSFLLTATLISFPILDFTNNKNQVKATEYAPIEVQKYLDNQDFKEKEKETLNKAIKIGQDSKILNRSGFWSWQDGLICVTDSSTKGFVHGHAALIAVAPYYYATVESNPGRGVEIVYGSWDRRYSNNHVWQVGVKGTSISQDRNAAQWAVNRLGLPYNPNFFYTSTRSSFYCSHLVWAAYLDTTGVNLDGNTPSIIHPLELVTNGKTITNYYH